MIAGSLPPSVPASFCARIVAELRQLEVETILDTEGEPLNAGLRAGPAAVTPNSSEAEGVVGHEFNDRDDFLSGLRSLVELGANEAVITRPDGCVASLIDSGERRSWEVTAPSLEPVAAVGSGDAFLAGFVGCRFEGRPRPTAFATRSPAAPNRPSISARALSIPTRSSGSSARSRSPSSGRPPRRSAELPPDAPATIAAGSLPLLSSPGRW